jgi:hypothetical protein
MPISRIEGGSVVVSRREGAYSISDLLGVVVVVFVLMSTIPVIRAPKFIYFLFIRRNAIRRAR